MQKKIASVIVRKRLQKLLSQLSYLQQLSIVKGTGSTQLEFNGCISSSCEVILLSNKKYNYTTAFLFLLAGSSLFHFYYTCTKVTCDHAEDIY